jgi:hypothetical protein
VLNLDIYNKVKAVPKEALTEIKAGRLKGKSNINPQWRIYKLTEMFGPCGVGWKYKITRQWIEEGANNEKAAFVNIDLFVKIDGEWSDAIPGNGGSSFVINELRGLHTSDEAYKMALTDAISVSCKALGIAADVYWSEGDKYTEQERVVMEEESVKERLKKAAEEFKKQNNIIDNLKKENDRLKKKINKEMA